jgi:uncharacterized phage protein (TIGR02218 family)
VVCVTNHVINIAILDSIFDAFGFDYGNTSRIYRADLGMAPTQIKESVGLSPDNYNLTLFADDTVFTYRDIQMRRWAQAEALTFTFDYTDLTKGIFEPRLCYVGQANLDSGAFSIEIKALATKAAVALGDITSETCRAQFGDDLCKVDLTGNNPDGVAYQQDNVAITTVTSQRKFTCSSLSDYPTGFFERGHITFLSGDNLGLSFDVESFSGGVFTLRMPTLMPFATTDTIFAQGGCKKTWRACWEDHDNAVNLRAEPNHPTGETLNQARPVGSTDDDSGGK